MGELKQVAVEQQDILVRVKNAGRQVAMAGLGLVDVLKAEGEKLQAVDFAAKAEEIKAKVQAIDVKAEAEKLQAIDVKAKFEELKVKAQEVTEKLQGVDAKAEVEKLVAEAQKVFADLVAKGEKNAA